MLKAGEDHKTPTGWGRWYQGYVVANDDSVVSDGIKAQRCKIRCADLHTGWTDDQLPWVAKGTIPGSNSAGGVGAVDVPVLGSKVWMVLSDDTPYHAVYFGGVCTEDTVVAELVGTDYPNVVASIDRTGSLWLRNTTTDEVKFIHVSGSGWYMDGDGNTVLYLANQPGSNPNSSRSTANSPGLTVVCMGGFTVTAAGDITLQTSSGKIKLLASEVDIGGGEAVVINAGSCYMDNANITGQITNAQQAGTAGEAGALGNGGSCPPVESTPSVASPATPTQPGARTRPTETPFVNQTNY